MRRDLARAQQTDRTLVVAEPDVLAGEEGLNAVLQTVRQRDFGNRRIDRYLQLRPIDIAYRALDDPIVLLVGVDHDRIIGGIRRDPHVLKGSTRDIPGRSGRTARCVRLTVLAVRERLERGCDRIGAAIVGTAACRRRRAPRGRAAVDGIEPGLGTLYARRNLLRGGIGRPAGSLTDENIVQDLCDLRRIAVFQTEGPQRSPRRVRPVKTIDPLRGLGQQLRIFRYHHHRIHARDRLEADDPLPQPAVAGFEYSLQLCDHRLGRGRFERIDADRLVLQPFHVEGCHHVERGLTLRGRALDQQQISGWNDANSTRA